MHWLSKKKYKIGLMIPTLLVYSIFIMLPIVVAVRYSFTKYSGIGQAKFIGLKNYVRLFQDEIFWISLKNTMVMFLLFPVYKINVFFGLRGKLALIFPYIATSISFNTLLLVGYLKSLPAEIDEAAIIDGCNIWDLMVRVILPMTKPVIATVVIFNVLYIWNEFPFASVMLRDVSDYTLSMGASFFKGTYTVDYGGIVASSVMIIIPELIFYGIFQKNIVEGMTAGAVKG